MNMIIYRQNLNIDIVQRNIDCETITDRSDIMHLLH